MAPDTRQRILDTARTLFNREGLAAVGVRDIARAVEISPGNLSYYFATKDDLVAALVMELHQVNARSVFAVMPPGFSLVTLYQAALGAMRNMLAYRFVLVSYVDAFRSSRELQRLETVLAPRRRARSIEMTTQLVKNGYVQRRALTARYLVEQGDMISSGWLNAAAFHPTLRTDEAIVLHYAKVGCSLFEPYCTPKGTRQLRKIVAGAYDASET